MAAISAVVFAAILGVAPAHGAPDNCADVCTARLISVGANTIDGTITGTPVGGGAAITLAGQGDAYLKSAGFGDAPPDAVQQWDATIDRVKNLSLDPSDPNSYGNGKARAFLPRTLNDLATQFPPDILVVRFAPDDAQSGSFRLVSIQPTAQ